MRAHALAELAAIPIVSDEDTSDDQAVAKQVVAELKPAERRWLKALGELLADGKEEIGHAMIAAPLGITESTSQAMPRRLRAHGLIPPEPPITNNSSFELTPLGWSVFALLSDDG